MDAISLKLPLNKYPNSDGLIADFNRFFWKDIGNLVQGYARMHREKGTHAKHEAKRNYTYSQTWQG